MSINEILKTVTKMEKQRETVKPAVPKVEFPTESQAISFKVLSFVELFLKADDAEEKRLVKEHIFNDADLYGVREYLLLAICSNVRRVNALEAIDEDKLTVEDTDEMCKIENSMPGLLIKLANIMEFIYDPELKNAEEEVPQKKKIVIAGQTESGEIQTIKEVEVNE